MPSISVDLPRLSTLDVKPRQPTSAPTISVQTNHVSQIKNFTVSLRRVSDHNGFARLMGRRPIFSMTLPDQHLWILVAHGQFRIITCMHKKVRFSLVERHATFEELVMSDRENLFP